MLDLGVTYLPSAKLKTATKSDVITQVIYKVANHQQYIPKTKSIILCRKDRELDYANTCCNIFNAEDKAN